MSAIVYTHTGQQSGTIDPSSARSYMISLSTARAVTTSWVPAICFTFGCLFVLLAIGLFIKGATMGAATVAATKSAETGAEAGAVAV